MLDAGDFYGYGSIARYVRFFAMRGTSISDIAEALGLKFVQLSQRVPEIDLLAYPVFPKGAGAWSNDEVRLLLEHYEANGPDWAGWRTLLGKRSRYAIRHAARVLGLYYNCD